MTIHVQRDRTQKPNAWLAKPLTVLFSAVAACLPAARLIVGSDALIQVTAVSLLGCVLVALGYVARARYFGLWVAAAVMMPAAGAISGLINSSLAPSFILGLTTGLMILTMACVFTRLIRERPQAVRYIVGWFLVGQTVSASAGILQLLGLRISEGLIFGRATGLAEHPNTLGLMSAIAILASLGAWRSVRGVGRAILVVVMVVNGAALVGTGSLSAMLALVAGLAVGILAARKVIGTAVTGILVLALAGGALAASNVEQTFLDSVFYRIAVVTGQSSSGGGAASLEVRELTYAWAWDWIARSPLVGVGLDPRNAGTFDGVTAVHNYLLRGWYQGGIIYVAWLAMLTLVLIFGTVGAALRRRADPWSTSIAFGILVFAFTAAFLNQPQYWLPLLMALTIATRSRELEHDDPTHASTDTRRPRSSAHTTVHPGASHSR